MGIVPSRNPWQRRTIPVQEDLACVYCGYNLRGLPLSGKCPECGGSIWDALLRRDIPALRSALSNAGLACLTLAGWPLILAMLIVLSPTSNATPAAGVALLFINTICMVIGGCFWVWMPIAQFQPGDKEQERILVLTALTFIGATVAGIYTITLSMGAPAAGSISTATHHGLGIAWDAVLLLSAGQMIVVLSVPARILMALHEYAISRVVQLIQILCIVVGVFALGSLLLEMTPHAGNLRLALLVAASVTGGLMTLSLSFATLCFLRQSSRPK